MTFDTRDRKPKLYNLAAVSLAAAAVTVILSLTGNVSAAGVQYILLAYLLCTFIILVDAFRKQLQYNPYSYNTILYAGFALFVLSMLVTHVYVAVKITADPAGFEIWSIISTLMGAPRSYMILSIPFILVFSVMLCISNISLIRHEGFRRANAYGIALSLILIAGEVFLLTFDYYVSGSTWEVMMHEMVVNLFASIYLYLECMLIGTITGDLIAAFHEPARNKDFIIILGCRPRRDGTPTPLLAGRIDRAVEFYNRQKKETGKELIFMPSGGQGNGEIMPESTSMRNYLISRGIPEDRIIEEDKSRNTFENMKYSKEKIMALDPNAKIAFSTTNYHVFRSGIYARRVKMRAVGMGAKTKWYFWPNASVREFVGLLSRHKDKQLIVLGAMIVVFLLLTYFAYSV